MVIKNKLNLLYLILIISTISFSIAQTEIDFINPLNNSHLNNQNLTITINITAQNISEITFNLNQEIFTNSSQEINCTYINENNSICNLTRNNINEGTYKLIVITNYSLGQFNQSINFTIDKISPQISILSPTSKNYDTNNSLELNITIIDNLSNITCWYNIKNSTNTITENTTIQDCLNNTITNTTFSLPFKDDQYTLTLYSNDSAGNLNFSNITFGVNVFSPAIVLISPQDNYYSNTSNTLFNFSASQNNDLNLSNCYLYTNKTGNWNITYNWTNIESQNITNHTTIELDDGIYTWNIFCNNSEENNSFAFSNYTLYVDTTPPVVNIIYPESTNAEDPSYLEHTASDNIELEECWYSLNNGQTNQTITCNAILEDLTPSSGSNTWIVWAKDKAQNTGYDSVTFSIESSSDEDDPSSSSNDESSTTESSTTNQPNIEQPFWFRTLVASSDFETQGFNGLFTSRTRVRIKINGEYHSVGVTRINQTGNSATINVSSEPQIATIKVGEQEKFNLDSDGYYDLLVKLNSIESYNANLTIQQIKEEIPGYILVDNNESTQQQTNVQEEAEKKSYLWLLWPSLFFIFIFGGLTLVKILNPNIISDLTKEIPKFIK